MKEIVMTRVKRTALVLTVLSALAAAAPLAAQAKPAPEPQPIVQIVDDATFGF
jgi:hypothetical protein